MYYPDFTDKDSESQRSYQRLGQGYIAGCCMRKKRLLALCMVLGQRAGLRTKARVHEPSALRTGQHISPSESQPTVNTFMAL